MNDSFVRTLVLGDVEISCLLVSQKGHSTLQSALPETLPVAGLWEKAPVPAALALQVLTGGPCLTLLPANKRNNVRHDPALAALHAECLVEQKAAVVVLEQAGVQPWELMLVPVNVTQGIQSIPAFWGFSVGEKAAIVTSELLAASRLPLVFDLDETLLVAYSAHSLENRLEALRMQRHMANDAAVNDADADRRSAAVIQRTALDKECNAVAKDLALLRQYAEADMLELDGSILAATEEEIVAEGKPRTFTRPVIRLPNQGVVFTRIDPERRETSMIMRTRPGWEALRAYLTGAMDRAPAKQRFELYVCTAAEREYALEAWRILDPAAQLIPHEQRAQRVVCVPSRRKKTLSEVLGLGLGLPSDNEAPATAMPLAVIVDDRLDVWEEGVQAQVLRVQPFIPHKMPISSQAVLDESDMRRAVAEEMGRVQAVLVALRANAYFTINEEMQQPVARLAAGMAVDMQTCVENPHKLLPAPPRIAALMKQQTQQAQHAQRQARQQHAAAAILNRGAFQAAQAQQDGSAQQPPALRPSAAKKPRLVQLIENASASYGIENPRGVLQSLVKARQLAPVCPRTKSHEGDPPVQAQRFFTSEVAVGPHHEVIGLGKAPGRKEAGRRAAVSAVRFLTHSPAWQPGQDAPAAEAGPEALWAYSLRLVEPSVRSVHRGEYADPGAAPSPASDDEDAWQSPGPAKKERNGRKAPASSPVDNRSMEVAPGGLQKPSSHTPMGELRERGITEQNALSTLYQFYPGGQVEIRANESSEMRFDLTALVVLPDKSWLTGQGQSNVNKATAKRRAAMAILEQLGCKMAPGWQGIKAASEPHPQGLEKAKAQALHVAQNCEANRKQQERCPSSSKVLRERRLWDFCGRRLEMAAGAVRDGVVSVNSLVDELVRQQNDSTAYAILEVDTKPRLFWPDVARLVDLILRTDCQKQACRRVSKFLQRSVLRAKGDQQGLLGQMTLHSFNSSLDMLCKSADSVANDDERMATQLAAFAAARQVLEELKYRVAH
ncbi:hypothetical protein WJX72_003895 [[Myrmecia] bisecta]|uniref:protein-serine/threonine phosphatase n=1 Tax=[Myrmecia] bisecta TaxID=41462 RepID=A0AAW1QAC0_9CHLO